MPAVARGRSAMIEWHSQVLLWRQHGPSSQQKKGEEDKEISAPSRCVCHVYQLYISNVANIAPFSCRTRPVS
jgi:hypothetical protein